jgi:SRSO17 transposase
MGGQALDDGDAVLIVAETADEKSSAGAAGAARRYSGTVAGIALCQMAVTLTYASGRGHALIGRALYLPEACAADDEHRELADVPKEVMFATKPRLAGALLERAQSLGIRGRSSARQAEHRPGRRAGHPLEILAPLDRDLPARRLHNGGSPARRPPLRIRYGRRAGRF